MIRDMIPKFMEEATAKDGDLDMDKFTDRFAEAIQSYYLSLLPKKGKCLYPENTRDGKKNKDGCYGSLTCKVCYLNEAISEIEAKIKET